jgi:O-antigen/teichoic acid export membrane protein
MIGSLFACFTNFVLNYIFIPKFGYYAAGYTTLVSYMALAFAHYIFVKKIQKEKGINNIYSYKILFVVSLIGTLIVLFIPLTYKYDAVRYAIILGVLAICFICRKRIMGVISNIKEMKKKKKVK